MFTLPQGLVWRVATPILEIPEVELDATRWHAHVITNHPEMTGKELEVKMAVSAPTAVVVGNPPRNYVFVNHSNVRSSGSPIVAVVSSVTASVVTALYDRRYAVIRPEGAIWLKP